MNTSKKIFSMILVFFFAVAIVSSESFAQKASMKLLAVRELENGTLEGGTADLYIEVRQGSGRVFLETFPLTKTDTQMSTRFAKTIACDMLEKNCDDLDFFYAITADSAIITGPSAGASIALLTAAVLDGETLNPNYAITGTINSGGLIGPVGGVKEKIEAANKIGIEKVIIPSGERNFKSKNTTIDLLNFSKDIGIGFLEVSTLEEAYEEFTGKKISKNYEQINQNLDYESIMKTLADEMCKRNNEFLSRINSSINASNSTSAKSAVNLTAKAMAEFENKNFYSSASYCFGANVEYTYLILSLEKNASEKIIKESSRIAAEIEKIQSEMDSRQKKTITDLEAYIVVKERLRDSSEAINQAKNFLSKNETERALRSVSYASERLNSANSWSRFFGMPGKEFYLDKEILKQSCQNMINDATERKQYVELYIPYLESVSRQISAASNEFRNENYEICLSIASKAKADVDVILGVFGVEESSYKNIAERKLEIARRNIARQSSKGIFPIIGYSYYEYSKSLIESDVLSSLLYSEYSLEMGNLDIYFKQKEKTPFPKIDSKKLGIFASGFVLGAVCILLVLPFRKRK